MNNEYQKYGISDDDIRKAALGDFDDYPTAPPQLKVPKLTQDPPKSKPQEKYPPVSPQPPLSDCGVDNDNLKELPKAEKNSGFYVIDFIKSLFTKEKVGVCIWLITNMLLISTPLGIFTIYSGNIEGGLGIIGLGLLLYLGSLTIAMSPVGEAILRWQNKCKKIKDVNIQNRLEPIFDRVCEKAKTRCPAISDSVKLFISRDDSPNAFATGRRTVCVTQGLLELSDEEIEGVLAHEFGHLAHKDTDTILAVAVGNMIVVGILTIFNAFANFSMILINCFSKSDAKWIYSLVNALFFAISYVWTKIGVLLCMHSSRKNEFAADNFAVELGYCNELTNALKELDGGNFAKPKGLWAALHDSHPATADRIVSMKEYALQSNKG